MYSAWNQSACDVRVGCCAAEGIVGGSDAKTARVVRAGVQDSRSEAVAHQRVGQGGGDWRGRGRGRGREAERTGEEAGRFCGFGSLK